MDELTHLGLDVHKKTTAVALLRPGDREPDHRVIPTTPEAYRKLTRATGTNGLVACYEAGPCGYDPYRILTSLGVTCQVIAPSLIPRRPGKRVKTDRLDARNLARFHRAGELTAIRVPTVEEEAIRGSGRISNRIGASPSSASSPSCCAKACGIPGPPRAGASPTRTGCERFALPSLPPSSPWITCSPPTRAAIFSSARSTDRSKTRPPSLLRLPQSAVCGR